MNEKFALKDVVPNPFRDLVMFPLGQWRIAKLVASIKENGFTPNVLGRVRDGKLQLAYGHHRVAALITLGHTEAEFIVQELSDDDMLQKMATDNDIAYAHGMQSVIENVRAAVLAFGDAKLKPEINKHTDPRYLRYAPSFTAGRKTPPANGVPYTALSVALKLNATESDGHGKRRASLPIEAALATLSLVEMGFGTIKSICVL
jgi:ParB-like nuclease domain